MARSTVSEAFTIDIVSDVICPWCFLGKRRLDKALEMLGGPEVNVRWRPFLLDPTIPPHGLGRRDYLVAKFGEARLRTMHDPLLEAARELGVPYDFEAITRTPNSIDAHRLIRWSHAAGLQNEMAERLFMAYWSEGKDVGGREVLANEAAAVGLNGGQTAELLASEQDVDSVKVEIERAYQLGITGVPTFIFDQRYAVAGAQSPDVLAEAIGKVLAERVA